MSATQPNDSNTLNALDCISRQAAIDALMEKDKKLRNINWYDKPYAEGECRGIDEALSIISNLPSVQPEQRWIMQRSDLIDRQAAIQALCKAVHKGEDIPCDNQTTSCLWSKTRVCDYAREIKALPSVQPERTKGKWIDDCSCSICHWIHEDDKGFALLTDYHFCPNCGADMRKETEDAVH